MVGSIASVIRDEVQQALHSHRYPQMPNVVPTDVVPAPMFADIQPRTYADCLPVPRSADRIKEHAKFVRLSHDEERRSRYTSGRII